MRDVSLSLSQWNLKISLLDRGNTYALELYQKTNLYLFCTVHLRSANYALTIHPVFSFLIKT